MDERITIPPIKLSDVEKMVNTVRRDCGETDVELTFEFILTAFFPNCWKNIQDALSKQYTLGYIAGNKERISPLEEDADYCCD